MDEQTPFSQHLAYIGSGGLDAEATRLLTKLVAQVQQTRRKGTLTLTLNLSMEKDMDSVMRVQGECKVKMPAANKPTSWMFPTQSGQLLRDDPEQTSMFEKPPQVIVDSETGEILDEEVIREDDRFIPTNPGAPQS